MTEKKNIVVRAAKWAASRLPAPVKGWLYKIPFASGLIRRALNASLPHGIHEVEIAGGILSGMRMALDLQREKDYWLGTYEPGLEDAARRFVYPGMTVFDVGANIGYISLMAAKLAGESGKVYAFEALPENAARLRENIRLNQLSERIRVFEGAVAGNSGKTSFLVHESGAMGKAAGSAGRDDAYSITLEVPSVSLDDFVYKMRNPVPDVIKMDIEGGEGQVLNGMRRLLSESAPVLLIELHGKEAARQVWTILEEAGYMVYKMSRNFPPVQGLDELDWKAYVVVVKRKQ